MNNQQTSVDELIDEQAGVTHKTVIVMFERSTGDIILMDASEDRTFFRGATVNQNYIVVAFLVPAKDLQGSARNKSPLKKVQSKGVYGFFKKYKLTSF